LYHNYTQNLKYKYTKVVPMENVKDITQREKKTKQRFKSALKCAQILDRFFENGFKSYEALKTIILFYNPEMDEKKIWDFWHFRNFDEEIAEKLEVIYDKLKQE